MKQVFINLPVSDLAKSTQFYEALGFTKNLTFSDENASSMMWSDEIVFMLLTREYYAKFLQNKAVADTTVTNATLIALTLDSREAVQQFADTAKANGGDYFIADPNKDLDFMFGCEVTDLDGNQLEPVWMNPDVNFEEM
ncbi:glyoxalase [Patescibacteria group bacterium]|nr:MAG: glyoxalase [Patescibacteria group bacterium]